MQNVSLVQVRGKVRHTFKTLFHVICSVLFYCFFFLCAGCTLHIIHNAAKKAATELPPVETVLVDIYFYFNKSAERQRRFKGTQELYGDEAKKLVKHVSTRWLSMGR